MTTKKLKTCKDLLEAFAQPSENPHRAQINELQQEFGSLTEQPLTTEETVVLLTMLGCPYLDEYWGVSFKVSPAVTNSMWEDGRKETTRAYLIPLEAKLEDAALLRLKRMIIETTI